LTGTFSGALELPPMAGILSAFDQRGNDTSVSVEILMTAQARPEQWNVSGGDRNIHQDAERVRLAMQT